MAKQTFHVCYHCKNRTIGCHANCVSYLKEKREYEKIKKMDENERRITGAINSLTKNKFNSIKKKRRTNKK